MTNWENAIQDALENDWVSINPKRLMIARVTLFDGKKLDLRVKSIHFWRGEPMRLYGFNAESSYKFKYDEEPFEIITAEK